MLSFFVLIMSKVVKQMSRKGKINITSDISSQGTSLLIIQHSYFHVSTYLNW